MALDEVDVQKSRKEAKRSVSGFAIVHLKCTFGKLNKTSAYALAQCADVERKVSSV